MFGKKNELVEQEKPESTEISTIEVTPMTMLQSAREQGADMETMQQLMEMQFKWERNEAQKAYNQAVAEFKKENIVVTKDKVNTQFKSRYSGIGNLVNTVNPILAKYGLSASWTIDQTDSIRVACKLSHALGHSEEVPMSGEPDTSGGGSKNPIQQIKSTITYLKIATYEAVTGVASSDDPGDNDGNTSKPLQLITEAQVAYIQALIDETGVAGKTALFEWLKIDSVDQIPAKYYKKAVQGLEARR